MKRLAQDTEGLTTLVASRATLSLPLIASIIVAAVPIIVSLLGFLPKSIRTLNSLLSLCWKNTELNIQAPSQHRQRTDTFVPLHKYCCPLCSTVNWPLFTKWGEENLGCVEKTIVRWPKPAQRVDWRMWSWGSWCVWMKRPTQLNKIWYMWNETGTYIPAAKSFPSNVKRRYQTRKQERQSLVCSAERN